MENQPEGQLTRHQRRLLRKQVQDKTHERGKTLRRFKRSSIWLVTFMILGGGIGLLVWQAASQPPVPESDIVARRGLHWHPELAISIKGTPQEISPNLGIGAAHNPMHTHDSTGVLHLEFQGLVTQDDIRLGKFFELWKKPFSSTCILDSCNGPDDQVKMTVNGQPNTEFERYIMHDKDKIEITFE